MLTCFEVGLETFGQMGNRIFLQIHSTCVFLRAQINGESASSINYRFYRDLNAGQFLGAIPEFLGLAFFVDDF